MTWQPGIVRRTKIMNLGDLTNINGSDKAITDFIKNQRNSAKGLFKASLLMFVFAGIFFFINTIICLILATLGSVLLLFIGFLFLQIFSTGNKFFKNKEHT